MINQRMKSEIMNRSANGLGGTEEGQAWCVKALHPSDPVSECAGIPDESAVPSAHMNFMSTFQFRAPGAASGDTWGFDMNVIPHPVCFGSLQSFDDPVTVNEYVPFNNTQLTGADHKAKYATFLSYAQKWRMTYCGVTLYQDGAALTNQGTLQACQRPVEPTYRYASTGTYTAGALTGAMANHPIMYFAAGDRTSFETVSNMPNAYVGRSADGCYMPLIMTSTCQKWHGEHDQVQYGGLPATSVGVNGLPMGTSSSTTVWPMYNLGTPYQSGTGAASMVSGDLTTRCASNIWGLISARNLDLTTSFTAVFRCGWELQCQPGTLLTPQLHISPPYDPRALAAYFAVRRELKDAYPADYNDWAKIWGVIKKVASFVLPGLSMFGPIGAAVGTAGGGALSVVDAITNAVRKKSSPVEHGRNPMPEAEKERAQDLVKAAAVLNRLGPGSLRIQKSTRQAPARRPSARNASKRY